MSIVYQCVSEKVAVRPPGLTQAGYEAAAIVEVVRQARLGAPRKASRSLKPFFGLSQ